MLADAPSEDHLLAEDLARAAGDLLLELRRSSTLTDRELGGEGDHRANSLILRRLARARAGDAILSEESRDRPARLHHDRVWIIDPLDGTREFSEGNRSRTDWAVHVALAVKGRPAACAVCLPALGLTLGTRQPSKPVAPSSRRITILVSRTRPPDIARKVAAALDAELVPMGSAGAKAAAVITGAAHAYLHAGGQFEWDSCAPVGAALAAGMHASRIDGESCVYNRPDVSMPDLLICRPELAGALLSAIRTAMPQMQRAATSAG